MKSITRGLIVVLFAITALVTPGIVDIRVIAQDPQIEISSDNQQTDLSGTYTGIVDFPDGGMSGYATLTIAGNQFTLTSDSETRTGRIVAVTTRGYTGVTIQFNNPQGGIDQTTIVSVRALRKGDDLTLISIPLERRMFAFSSRARGSRQRGRNTASSDTATAGAGNANMGGMGGTGRRRRRGRRRSSGGGDLSTAILLPDFPWPPPRASATTGIPKEFLLNSRGQTYLRDVSDRLERALNQAGYSEMNWYGIPNTNGFVIVSRLEQFKDDGTPLNSLERWVPEMAAPQRRSLRDFINILFKARQGHYRVITFIVTPVPFSQTSNQLSRDGAIELVSTGASHLPQAIGDIMFSNDYNCTALIYEFEQATPDHSAEFKYPGTLDGKTHLQRCGIWDALKRQ